jgi:signal transduction histidine kinase
VRLRSNVAPRLNRIQIGRLLEDVAVTSEVEAAARRIDLQVNAEPGLEMDADAHMILSSISNLVRNAIKFTPEGGTVLVRAKSADRAIEIDVQDECGGLSPEQEARLSNPTLHHTTDPQGMGLGLSIVHQAVRLHGGRVVLINVPGKGCVFTVVLPRDNFPHPPQG